MKELSLINSRLDGRYEIQTELGRGSYAEIFTARDALAAPNSPHATVVIKALNVFLQNDLDTDLERTLVENFQNEAIALDRVRHPNIISRLGHGTARDLRNTVFHYLVLEYLPGGDLARACREKSLTLQKALFYIEQVCAGLSFAHSKGIIHRDIKPQNLLLTADRRTVKIADFGVARTSAADDAPITRVGTNMFAPPEHSPMLAGMTGTLAFTQLTPAADIYSLAKSAYVLITCESPRFFSNQPITELPFAMRQKPWAKDLLRVLERATQTDSRARYQTVNEFWKDLSAIKALAEADAPDASPLHVSAAPNSVPQAHVAKGYSPLAPQVPQFKNTSDLRMNPKLSQMANAPVVVKLNESAQSNNIQNAPPPIIEKQTPVYEDEIIYQAPARQRSSFLRRSLVYLTIIGLFAGMLYATSVYLRGRSIMSQINNPFAAAQDATALMDINLRAEPNKNSDPIGIVTKDSRIKINDTNGNWYKISIVAQGSQPDAPTANEGWISSKARNGDDTIKISR